MSIAIHWTLAEIGRLAHEHALDPEPIGAALGIGCSETRALCGRSALPEDPRSIHAVSAMLVLNILVRIETRCGGDSIAMRAALDRPLDTLDGGSIGEALTCGPDLTELRDLRELAGTMPVPKIRMWRMADCYS